VREGDIYMASFDYDLGLVRYQKADTLFQRFPNDPDLKQKIEGLRKKMKEAVRAKGGQGK